MMYILIVANMKQKGGNQMLKFKAFLVENRIKQKEVAELLNLSVQNTNRKINGVEPFTLDQVKILCKHYKIRADEFFI